MRTSRLPLVATLLALAGLTLLSGCAHVVEVLQVTADELNRQQQEMAYQSYLQQNYYYGRPSSDTSAPGIK